MNNLLVVIEQEAFHNQNVRVLIGVAHISCRCEINTMGTGKLHWVLDPAFNRVGHCLHVQSRDHCGVSAKQQELSHLEQTHWENLMFFIFHSNILEIINDADM